MNQSTLLQSTFSMDGPITADNDYTGTPRHFPGPISFSLDDEDGTRNRSTVGHPLAQPVSIPASNGLRYSTQQAAMQDVPFATSPTILMSPSDSCSEPFSPTSASIYSHSPGLSYDRMSDFRSQRVPPLQPPSGMSPGLQSQNAAVPGSTSLLTRNDGYSASYVHRNTFPSLSNLGDMSRISPYSALRTMDTPMDRSQSYSYGPSANMLLDPGPRLPQPTTDAPPFYETDALYSMVAGNQTIKPEIQAKIHKGFFLVDDKWTCYRRNYFSVSCSFSLHPWTIATLYLKFPDQGTQRILNFSMSISAIVNEQHGEVRELVQHTPKRDKQSERKPAKVVLQPCQAPPLVLGHGTTSTAAQHGFSFSSATGLGMDYSSYNTSPPTQPPTQHTFERIQFQKATANNGKRRAQQQYYNLVVELYAEIPNPVGGSETQWIKIARRSSHPMVVRGRSPGHYKDSRRDSSTSMGPDGGSGDGGGGTVLPPGIGPAARSHLTLMSYDSSQRGGPHYGRPDYHQMAASDQSSLSESPHVSSSSSSAFDIGVLNESMDSMDSMKPSPSMDSYQDPGFGMMEDRKPVNQYSGPLHQFEYDVVSKDAEQHNTSFPEQFDSMVNMLPVEQRDSSHFLKHPPRMPAMYHSGPGGYAPVNSTRGEDCRFQNSQSLCA
ncbi:p53-like transcription factor [Aspergillus ambiguus]|uniref:NDT80 / PhoG like DNA-binding family protein n=1 Tax=Aspergillus ambiguus TaxID=176160 RepID=UPI003CCD0F1B